MEDRGIVSPKIFLDSLKQFFKIILSKNFNLVIRNYHKSNFYSIRLDDNYPVSYV